jgi:uncharacterized SAM-binding protein YcdF (DUF218 family)
MFFALSKTLGDWLTTPHYLALSLFALALLLRLLKRASRLRRALVWSSIGYLWLMATGAFANLLLYPLESRHARPEKLARPPLAIVMLTGATDGQRTGPGIELTEASDRFVEAVRLAHLHPGALLVFSGGSSDLIGPKRYREAEALAELAAELGVARRRIVVDRQSRNTRENALRSAELLRARKLERGPVLLVTSASHMPRSVGCFAKVGLEVVPWPTDYWRTRTGLGAFVPKPGTLMKSDAALHEYVGWLSYKLAGYL